MQDYISTTYDRASDKERNAVGFVMTIYRRRLASSFAALERTLAARLDAVKTTPVEANDDDLPDDELGDEALDQDEAAQLEKESLRVEEMSEIGRLPAANRQLPTDTKAGRLLHHIEALRSADYPQAIVFTQYTDTLDFRDRKRKADVLLRTDAAAEGLSLQFCGALVNYDMPWNPVRVEQPIGRVDRLGQDFETSGSQTCTTTNTVETDVYRALRQRIRLLSRFVGMLQPIVARLPQKFAEVALTGREERDLERETLTSDIAEVSQREADSFDIDAVTEADLVEPPRPPPLYHLDDLDALLRRPELLPRGVEVRRKLSPREYEYTHAGLVRAPLRVTTDPQRFDEHPGTYELWSPGSPVFPAVRTPELPSNERIDSLRALLNVAGSSQ